MRYQDSYIYSHDIDWFCVVNGYYIHVASAGGTIPSQINDKETLWHIQHQIELLPDLFTDNDILFNEDAISNVLGNVNEKRKAQYVESFVAMARKGFASFDRTFIDNPSNNNYHLVCRPKDMSIKPHIEELFSFEAVIGLDNETIAIDNIDFVDMIKIKNVS